MNKSDGQSSAIARTAWVLATALLLVRAAVGCPFCTALKPTLAQQREAARAVALAECTAAPDAVNARAARFRVHQWLKAADDRPASVEVEADRAAGCTNGALALLFQEGGASARWKAVPVSEIALQYLVRAPDLRRPTPERLAYFIKYLEHADPLIAEDAYLEFGLASYDDVRAVGENFDSDALRKWLTDPQVPPERKGFYGIALGIAALAQPAARNQNVALLAEQVEAPAADFRAGFDGVLGGYLAAQGEGALAEIDRRYLTERASREGDIRHALAAVRFAAEFLPAIPKPQIAAAVGHLLDRPEFASEAIVDLARWEDWTKLEPIAALYGDAHYPQPATDRAVVGYLTVCPEPAADDALDALRKRDPDGVAAAERVLRQLGRVRD